MDRQRLFVDMDGTITVFKKLDTLEVLYDEYSCAAEPQFRCGVSHLSGTA